MSVVLIDLIGLKNFVQGFGIQLFGMGIGTIIGPPMIGKFKINEVYRQSLYTLLYQYAFQFSGALFDITGNHYAGFSFAGSLFLCSGLVFSLLPWVKHFEGTEGEKMPLKEDTSTSEG